jgi:hypothetical protein
MLLGKRGGMSEVVMCTGKEDLQGEFSICAPLGRLVEEFLGFLAVVALQAACRKK